MFLDVETETENEIYRNATSICRNTFYIEIDTRSVCNCHSVLQRKLMYYSTIISGLYCMIQIKIN